VLGTEILSLPSEACLVTVKGLNHVSNACLVKLRSRAATKATLVGLSRSIRIKEITRSTKYNDESHADEEGQ